MRLSDFTCIECGKMVMQGVNITGKCYECNQKEEQLQKEKWNKKRRYKKTLKQRIEWIEDWIYNHEKNHPHNDVNLC